VAIDGDGNGYLLADDSGRYSPPEWAQRALALYTQYGADRIVAEKNQGGDMVAEVIRAQQRNAPITLVHASRGKVTRAEPVAALYERGKVYHAGEFPQLEDQLCQITVGFDRNAAGFSPDRMDALVWGFSELFPQMTRKATAGKPIVRKVGTLA
jgi:predicted phage terminase large subunit-like protein